MSDPILHLIMNDVTDYATVEDSAGANDQTIVDPNGNESTRSHSRLATAGHGRGLLFDGVDDRIAIGSNAYEAALEGSQNFSLGMWWKTNSPASGSELHFLSNYADGENCLYFYTHGGDIIFKARMSAEHTVTVTISGGVDGKAHHYMVIRDGTTVFVYRDGSLVDSDTNSDNLSSLKSSAPLSVGRAPGGSCSPGLAADLRIFDEAIDDTNIENISAFPSKGWKTKEGIPTLSAAIQKALQNNKYVARLLSQFDFGDGVNRPSVFVGEPAPYEAETPLMVILGNKSSNQPAVRGFRGRQDSAIVKIWLPQLSSDTAIQIASNTIHGALERKPVSIDGFSDTNLECSLGARIMDPQDGFPGVEFSVEASLLEE